MIMTRLGEEKCKESLPAGVINDADSARRDMVHKRKYKPAD